MNYAIVALAAGLAFALIRLMLLEERLERYKRRLDSVERKLRRYMGER